MTPPSPATAPKRDDLPFLRHRAKPKAAPPPAPAARETHGAAANPALAAFIASGGRPSRTPPGPSAPSAPAAPAAPLTGTRPTSADLDLSTAAPAVTPARPGPAKRQGQPRRDGPRTQAGRPFLLTPNTPTVTLSRLQSGVGGLTIEALFSAAVGDLRLACAYQLRSGQTTLARHGAAAPIFLDPRGRINIDLRGIRTIERFAVLGYSQSRVALRWGGTLVVTTFGGARIEAPLERAESAGAAMLLSAYNVRGELVLRAEYDEPSPSVRDACKALGYDRITWRDDRTPVD